MQAIDERSAVKGGEVGQDGADVLDGYVVEDDGGAYQEKTVEEELVLRGIRSTIKIHSVKQRDSRLRT